jgi:uncharacterized membrane protein SpoIIM required for sporulation
LPPTGAAPGGVALGGAAPSGVALGGAAPSGAALGGAAPSGVALGGAAPSGVALGCAAPSGVAAVGVDARELVGRGGAPPPGLGCALTRLVNTMLPVDLDAYVAEHQGEWLRLEQLSTGRKLSAAEVDELVALYQRTATHLSVVRSRSPDPALVARLSRLVLTARTAITGGSRFAWRDVGRFFTVSFPVTVYRAWPWWSAVATGLCAVTAFLIGYVAGHPEVADRLLGPAATQRLVEEDFANYYTEYLAPNFAFHLWVNNAWLAAQCLAAGVLIVPVGWLLWRNAVNVGVVGGIMVGNERAGEFFGLVTPHGLLELTGIFVAAGIGLRIGWAWIAPGPDRTRGRALAETARAGMVVALGLVGLFAVAGLIEAFVTPAPLPTALRVGIGAVAWVGFLGYVVILGRRADRAGASADIPD